jgi:hypothetical protein
MCHTESTHHFQASVLAHWEEELLALVDSDTLVVCSVSEVRDVIELDELKREPFDVKAT